MVLRLCMEAMLREARADALPRRLAAARGVASSCLRGLISGPALLEQVLALRRHPLPADPANL